MTQHEFTPEDDKQIVQLVSQNGNAWLDIAKEMDCRFSPVEIRCRYFTQIMIRDLNKKPPWTDEDTIRLAGLVERHGKKWTWFSNSYFHKRCPSFLKKKYDAYLKKGLEENVREVKAEKTEEEKFEELFPDPPSDFDSDLWTF